MHGCVFTYFELGGVIMAKFWNDNFLGEIIFASHFIQGYIFKKCILPI